MRRVIVTGANGFIGSSLIKKLLYKDTRVVALDVSFANSRLPKDDRITKIETDLSNIEVLKKQIPEENYDIFYHFAWRGVNGPDKASPYIQLENERLAVSCADLAKSLKVGKILYAGTVAERNVESLNSLKVTSGGMMYGTAKHCAHLMIDTYCKHIGQKFVWMQFSNIYGPQNKTGNLVSYTLGQLSKGEAATFGPAQQPYDFIYIDDLLEAVERLGEKNTLKNYYFIGSGEPRILREYLSEIGRVYGREDLIRIGERPDDGIRYSFNMFDTTDLKDDIGNYVSGSFTEHIEDTIKNY